MQEPPENKFPLNGSLTYGGRAVGLEFNPSGDPNVDRCKEMFANIIDQMDQVRAYNSDPEVARMCSIAVTEAQTAQMWAVKTLTWRQR